MKDKLRKERYQKLPVLEGLLKEMEELLGEMGTISERQVPELPLFFIVGSPRSGTTLLYQFLAQTGLFAYPSNTISRFYYAPYIGARVQQLLFEADFKEEILPNEFLDRSVFSSDLGKTQGPLAPHEFWYFWRRFFSFGEVQKLDRSDLDERDLDRFQGELGALEYALGAPLLMKGMILNWDLDLLSELFPGAIFLHVERDLLSNARSLLKARERFFGTKDEWYSFKPPKYPELKELSPEEQVVEQVAETNKDISDQIEAIGDDRFYHLSYEAFCDAPFQHLCQVWEKAFEGRSPQDIDKRVEDQEFERSGGIPLDDESEERLREAVERRKANENDGF